jgi:lamin B
MSSATNGTTATKPGRSPSQNKDVVSSSSSGTGGHTSRTPIAQSIRDSLYSVIRSTNGNTSTSNRSPVSPSRITRMHEKEEMQNLNDRLVIYIDTVRRLEQENTRLQGIVMTYNESATRDVSEIKLLYEKELEDAKKLIDELAKEKAKFEIALNKASADAEEAQAKLSKREKDFKGIEAKLKASESESLEYKSRYESIQVDNVRKQEELEKLKPAYADLEKQLIKLRKQLEDETLLRVDLENKNQTLKEDLIFKSAIYDKEVDQLRSSKRVEIEQVDVRLRDEYDSRLVSELQRIRDETEYKIQEMKDEVERRFHNKLMDADANVKRLQQSSNALKDEVTSYRSRNDELSSELKQTQTKLASNDGKIREFEEKLRQAALKYDRDILEKDTQLNDLRKEMQELLLEYQELHDIKINLDIEIGAYRKLLESEEQRLNISTSMHQSMNQLSSSYLGEPSTSSGATSRAKKRKQAPVEQEDLPTGSVSYNQTQVSQSGIEIAEHDFEGKCVRLINTTDKDIPIGGWSVKRIADGQEIDYKFGNRAVLKPSNPITIWSNNSGVNAEPPNEIVFQNKWPIGDSMITLLNDKEANVSFFYSLYSYKGYLI